MLHIQGLLAFVVGCVIAFCVFGNAKGPLGKLLTTCLGIVTVVGVMLLLVAAANMEGL
jgi:hypothetical protein